MRKLGADGMFLVVLGVLAFGMLAAKDDIKNAIRQGAVNSAPAPQEQPAAQPDTGAQDQSGQTGGQSETPAPAQPEQAAPDQSGQTGDQAQAPESTPQPDAQPQPDTQQQPESAPADTNAAPSAQQAGGQVTILEATYGTPDTARTCNAAAAVAEACNTKPTCSISATDALCGDPDYGAKKQLVIHYACAADMTRMASVIEPDTLTLDCR